ncbi:hypothetical protein FRC08_000235 [Ceratobasidium sp. 394]|nr:hypothetical protein FRC08_000235 [Ceratobasidium sp. 394]
MCVSVAGPVLFYSARLFKTSIATLLGVLVGISWIIAEPHLQRRLVPPSHYCFSIFSVLFDISRKPFLYATLVDQLPASGHLYYSRISASTLCMAI